MWLSRCTKPELKGSYLGWSGSIHQAGGIVSALLSGTVVWQFGVRGVYITGAILMCLMFPVILRTAKKDPEKAN